VPDNKDIKVLDVSGNHIRGSPVVCERICELARVFSNVVVFHNPFSTIDNLTFWQKCEANVLEKLIFVPRHAVAAKGWRHLIRTQELVERAIETHTRFYEASA